MKNLTNNKCVSFRSLVRRKCSRHGALLTLLSLTLATALSGCGWGGSLESNPLSYNSVYLDSGEQQLTGQLDPIRDPSMIYSHGTYYVYSTDARGAAWPGNIPFFCSQDRLAWKYCGSVFNSIPPWIQQDVPKIRRLWGPDISYFGGLYHLYYSATINGSQNSVIALATNTTLDPTDPAYNWVDRGAILRSHEGDDFNAIDPDIIEQPSGAVWMTYGSFWTGIKQVQLDPASGNVKQPSVRYDLAARPGVHSHAIEGSSVIRHGSNYYLFVSIDRCCTADLSKNDYKIAVGRSASPNGPYYAIDGTPMLSGGATVVLEGDGVHWAGVGGEQLYYDTNTHETLLVYHAQDITKGGAAYLRIRSIKWTADDWPVIQSQ